MEGRLIVHVVNVACTSIIESGIYSISIGIHMEGIVQVIEPLNFIPIHLGGLESSKDLEG